MLSGISIFGFRKPKKVVEIVKEKEVRKTNAKNKTFTCIICGESFVRKIYPSTKIPKVCSLKCRGIHCGLNRKKEKELREIKKTSNKFERNCLACGKEFKTNINSQRYCGKECRPSAQPNYTLNLYRSKLNKEETIIDEVINLPMIKDKKDEAKKRICIVCNNVFTPYHHKQTICSDDCKKQRNREIFNKHYSAKKKINKTNKHNGIIIIKNIINTLSKEFDKFCSTL